jgi:hypothetical protein
MTKSLKVGIGPIPAREVDVSKANVINALLTRPIAVLPTKAGDPIRPFAVGLWNGIRPLLKPEYSVTTLRRATGAYLPRRDIIFPSPNRIPCAMTSMECQPAQYQRQTSWLRGRSTRASGADNFSSASGGL